MSASESWCSIIIGNSLSLAWDNLLKFSLSLSLTLNPSFSCFLIVKFKPLPFLFCSLQDLQPLTWTLFMCFWWLCTYTNLVILLLFLLSHIYITAFLFPGLIHVVYIFMGILPKQLHEECNRTHELNSVVKFIRLKTVTHEGFIILSLIV